MERARQRMGKSLGCVLVLTGPSGPNKKFFKNIENFSLQSVPCLYIIITQVRGLGREPRERV